LPAPFTDAMAFTFTTNLSQVRGLAEERARMAGLPDDRVADFVIAVAEIAANTVRHARSPGSMEIWQLDDEIVCEIRDDGVIAGAQVDGVPPPEAAEGHGLWIAYQVCDRVDLRSGPDGTVIRLHMSLRKR
jgi:anti-sigma regulatory factor (Ser/Thr protein kinase)